MKLLKRTCIRAHGELNQICLHLCTGLILVLQIPKRPNKNKACAINNKRKDVNIVKDEWVSPSTTKQ